VLLGKLAQPAAQLASTKASKQRQSEVQRKPETEKARVAAVKLRSMVVRSL